MLNTEIILIPICQNGTKLKKAEEQAHLISQLISEGWEHQGTIKVSETNGTETECVKLTRETTGVSDRSETTEVHINVQNVHAGIFRSLIPFFGKDIGEIMYALALRWVESNIGTPQILKLLKLN